VSRSRLWPALLRLKRHDSVAQGRFKQPQVFADPMEVGIELPRTFHTVFAYLFDEPVFHVSPPRNASGETTSGHSFRCRPWISCSSVYRSQGDSVKQPARTGRCPVLFSLVGECAFVLPIEEGTIQDGGADEVGEAFETGFGGGRGDHDLFLRGEADIDLGGSLHEGDGLGRGLAGFEHHGDGRTQRLLRGLVALVRRVPVSKDGRELDGRTEVAETFALLDGELVVAGDLTGLLQDRRAERLGRISHPLPVPGRMLRSCQHIPHSPSGRERG
jgi:hypothetical protein